MDYNNWAQLQQIPPQNPNPNSISPEMYATNNYAAQHHLTPNQSIVDANQSLSLFQTHPPDVNTTPHMTVTATYAHQTVGYDPNVAAAAAAAAFYQDPNIAADAASHYQDPNVAAAAQSWAAALMQYASTYATVAPLPTMSQNFTKYPKKPKIAQSSWCEVCKISCNSKDVLDKHKLGKKHKKNLEKLIGSTSTPLPNPTAKPIIGPEQKPNPRKKSADANDLETKRRKVLEGGAKANSVRLCVICNVVCNSETVFNTHLVGKQHVSMLKTLAENAGV